MEKFIVFYDGFCPLCNLFVRVVLKYDKQDKFLVTANNSDFTKKKFGNIIPVEDSVVVYDGTKFYVFSQAVFFILNNLSLPFRIFTILQIIPRNVLDYFYRIIANNRDKIRLKNYCNIPNERIKQKILL